MKQQQDDNKVRLEEAIAFYAMHTYAKEGKDGQLDLADQLVKLSEFDNNSFIKGQKYVCSTKLKRREIDNVFFDLGLSPSSLTTERIGIARRQVSFSF